MNFRLLTAAAVLSTAIAAPALARDSHGRSDAIRQPQTQDRIYNRHSGFWPGEVAAGVVGGAIGTAGAIATAPFRNSSGGVAVQGRVSITMIRSIPCPV